MKYAIRRLLLLSTLGGSLASGGLVSHYTFDETGGTTATDSGPAGANGTLGANVTLGTAGKFGTAFPFHKCLSDPFEFRTDLRGQFSHLLFRNA